MQSEIKRKLIIKILEFSKTKGYFLDHIQSECSLGKMIAENVIFEKGFFSILLPRKADSNKVYQLSEGGINPLVSTEEIYTLQDKTFKPKKKNYNIRRMQ